MLKIKKYKEEIKYMEDLIRTLDEIYGEKWQAWWWGK
jgi:hypothetical protein